MRSLLFIPANDTRKLDKGLRSGADALIVDLEDAVPPAEKVGARGICSDFVSQHRDATPLFVRVNALSTGLLLDDLVAVVRARPYGIMLPKCTGGGDVALVGAYLAALEAREGVPSGSIRILPIVTELATALFDMGSYARLAGPRLCGMLWGAEDLATDVGASANRHEGQYAGPFLLARSLCLFAATAAGVPAIGGHIQRVQDKEHALALGLKAIGQLAGHGDRHVIGPRHQRDQCAQRVGQLPRILPQRKRLRDGKAFAVRGLEIGAPDIQCQPLHKLLISTRWTPPEDWNCIEPPFQHNSNCRLAATSIIASARLPRAKARKPT
jgi:citrate lyase subunit beta/citryl-CoA lyase